MKPIANKNFYYFKTNGRHVLFFMFRKLMIRITRNGITIC